MIQKWLYLGNHQSNLLQNLTQCSWGCALPPGGIIYVQSCHRVHMGAQNISRMLFWQKKQGNIQPGVFLLCSEVIPGCPVSSIL